METVAGGGKVPESLMLGDLIADLNTTATERQIAAVIERLNISADAKALLHDLSRITMQVGKAVVQLGKKILSFVVDLVKRFPNTTFGLVLAVTLSTLVGGAVGGVWLVGPPLAAILSKLLILFGLTTGAVADFKEAGIRAEVAGLERKVAIVAKVA